MCGLRGFRRCWALDKPVCPESADSCVQAGAKADFVSIALPRAEARCYSSVGAGWVKRRVEITGLPHLAALDMKHPADWGGSDVGHLPGAKAHFGWVRSFRGLKAPAPSGRAWLDMGHPGLVVDGGDSDVGHLPYRFPTSRCARYGAPSLKLTVMKTRPSQQSHSTRGRYAVFSECLGGVRLWVCG
jgi:hypothetical protein